jgi:serine/threonine protein kinase
MKAGEPVDGRSSPPVVPDYTLLRVIGEGSYGQVWLARGATGTFFAVKVVERDATGDGREFARAFRGLRHYEPISRQDENLMDVLHVGPSDPESYFYSVMELADNAPAPSRTFGVRRIRDRSIRALTGH